MKITFFQRKPFQDFVSIEHIFDMVRNELRDKIEARVHISKYQSKGIWKRVYNILEAVFRQGEVNHITGDIHFLTFLLSRKKTILTIHDLHFLKDKKKLSFEVLRLFWVIIPCHRVKYITVISNYTALQLQRVYNNNNINKKIRVIGNPVNPLFKRVEQKFDKEKPTLLQIGTKKRKGLERLIEAIKNINCHLCIIGTLSDKQKELLIAYNIAYSNFQGLTIKQLVKKYQKADIITFISTHEGFGMPIIEANAVGRAVITGNSTSIPEVANNAALMVNPHDIQAIRNGIFKLINDDNYRNQLIENGFENAKRFQLETIANQYLELYKEVNSSR